MSEPYGFPWKRILADVTVTQVIAGATHTTSITGTQTDSAGSSQITLSGSVSSINSTALSGLLGDATDLIIYPPTTSAGASVDVQIWPYVDGVDLGDKEVFDGSWEGNMMPNPSATVGKIHVSLGVSVRQAIAAGMSNLPLKITGLKAKRQYQFRVTSATGWNTANGDTPMRIQLLGDELNQSAVDALSALGYKGGFTRSVAGFQSLGQQNHQIPGGVISAASWSALPGGVAQGGTRVFRFMRNAYNNAATPAQTQYVMSNQNAVGGASNQVAGDNYDLGFDYQDGTRYLEFTEFGIRQGLNGAFVGLKVNDTVLPTSQGLFVTPNANPYQYGNAQNQRASSGLNFAMGKTPFPAVAFRNKVAYFIGANGTAIAANATSLAVGGILVELGQTA